MLKRIALVSLFVISTVSVAVSATAAQAHTKGVHKTVVAPVVPQGLCPKGVPCY